MDFVKRYPVLTGILSVCVAAFLVELFFLWKFSTTAATADKALASAKSAAHNAEMLSPAPTQDNLDAANKNVDDLKKELADVDHTLQDTPKKVVYTPPAAGGDATTDLFNQIESFKENLNDKAKAQGIILPTNEYSTYSFGLSLYTGHGKVTPPADKIPLIYTQMKVLDYVLGILFDQAKQKDIKMKLVAVQREDVTAPKGAAVATASSDSGGVGDLFNIPDTTTARVPGAIDTLAFRVQFIAYSPSLRILLNELAKFDMPIVVRSVEVDPVDKEVARVLSGGATGPRSRAATTTGDNSALKPVVTDNYSQFTITFEYVMLPPPPPDPNAPAAAADASGTASGASTAPATASASASAH